MSERDVVTRVIKLKDTGERVRYFVRRSWNKVYYSFDHELTWHSSKLAALKAARDNGCLAVAGKPVSMPNGLIAIAA
jgi:hypothetical protein